MKDRQGAKKNQALINAWIDGATIQIQQSNGRETRWADDPDPSWESAYTYRIKPIPPRTQIISFTQGDPHTSYVIHQDDFDNEKDVEFVELTPAVREALKDIL